MRERPFASLMSPAASVLALAWLLCSSACSEVPDPAPKVPEEAPPPAAVEEVKAPQDLWWEHLASLCGQAFAGTLVSDDPADAGFAGQSLTMHIRRCEPGRLEIPLHVGEDRSRTWVLTRGEDGLRLRHDHRHEDGSEDAVTLYGGYAGDGGTAEVQHFPADAYSRELFTAQGLDASVANIWTMERVAAERFSYILRRPNRHFQVNFDLTQSVDPPPAPWGHEDG